MRKAGTPVSRPFTGSPCSALGFISGHYDPWPCCPVTPYSIYSEPGVVSSSTSSSLPAGFCSAALLLWRLLPFAKFFLSFRSWCCCHLLQEALPDTHAAWWECQCIQQTMCWLFPTSPPTPWEQAFLAWSRCSSPSEHLWTPRMSHLIRSRDALMG